MNRNFNKKNKNQYQNQNQNQMPKRFNAGNNSRRNMQNKPPQWQQEQQQRPQLKQQQEQFGMFYEDRGNNIMELGMVHRFANESHSLPAREPQFRQERSGRSPMNGPQDNVRRFNCSPDRAHFNHSPDRGAGSGYQQGQLNRNRSREREPSVDFHRQSFCSPTSESDFQMNMRPDREFGYQCSPERESGFQNQQSMRSPERELGFQSIRYPEPYRNQRSRSPHGREFNEAGRRSRSPIRGMRHMSPTYPRGHSPRRAGGRESPPFGRAGGPGPRRSPGDVESDDLQDTASRPELNANGAPHDWRRPQRKWEVNLPPLGQPGGRDDPNKRRLSGSRCKWYMRYLQRGFPADDAFRMAQEPRQPAANYDSGPNMPAPQQMHNWERPSEEDLDEESSSNGKQNTSQDQAQNKELQICLLPVGYPHEKLSKKDKVDLEEAILQEVVTAGFSLSTPLRFSKMQFKGAYLKVTCSDRASADWLMNRGAHLYSYHGHPVIPKRGNANNPKPKHFYVTVYLARAADKTDEFLFALLKSQNQYKTHLWKLISRKDLADGTLLVISIDAGSAIDIAANDYSLYYRYGKVAVHGLRKKFGDKSPPRISKASANRVGKNPKNQNIPKNPKNPKPAETVVEEKPIPISTVKSDSACAEVQEIQDDSPCCIDLESDDDDVCEL